MKKTIHVFLIFTMVFGAINLYAQLEGKRLPFQPKTKPAFSEQRNSNVVTCGVDTIAYPYVKELVFTAPNDSFFIDAMVGNVRTASQGYVLNQKVKIHGVQFWGMAYSANSNYKQTLAVKVYLYAVDAYFSPVSVVDSTIVTITQDADFYEALFNVPVSYSQNFAVGVRSQPNDTLAVITNNAGNVWATNYGEGLAWRRFGSGTWNSSLSFFGQDLEYMIFPIVSYEVAASFTPSVNSGCVGTTVNFTNNSSPILENRMFNLTAFDDYWNFAQDDSSFSWNYGDGPAWSKSKQGSHQYTSGGTFNVRLAATSTGYYSTCSDTLSTTVVIQPAYTGTDAKSICQGDSYVFGTQTLTAAGVYTEKFKSSLGCDSTVTLTLKVNPKYTVTDARSICQGDSYVFGTQTLTTAGVYMETFKSFLGCDSTVTLTLTVNPKYTVTDARSICQGDSYVFGTQTLTTAGVYTETFKSSLGCDSTVTLTLTVNPTYTLTDAQTICDGDSYVFGTQILTTAGVYTEKFKSSLGCDSTVTLTLSVYKVDVSVTVNGASLMANLPDAVYQWLDCNDGYKPIPGATQRFFTATASGDYGVSINKSSCQDTSDCIPVVVTGINSMTAQQPDVSVYPNPSEGTINIDFKQVIPEKITITNTLAEVVKEIEPKAASISVDLEGLNNSIYFVHVQYKQFSKILKVLKH